MIRFNDLLDLAQVEVGQVSLMLHNTPAMPLRTMLGHLAATCRDVFDAYQSVHSDQAGASLKARPLVAVFVPGRAGQHLFEGLYRVAGREATPARTIYSNPAFELLASTYGDAVSDPETNTRNLDMQDVFEFQPQDQLAPLRGRVTVASPGGLRPTSLTRRHLNGGRSLCRALWCGSCPTAGPLVCKSGAAYT